MTAVARQGGAQTVDRALEVLRHVVLSDRPLLLEDLVSRVNLSRSVTYRLVRSLEHAGYVSRDPRQGGYAIGPAFLSMSMMTARRFDASRTVRPAMERIVAEFGETASFHIRNGDFRVCTDVVEGTHAIRRVISVGETLPLYAGETGRVLLSALPAAQLDDYVAAAAEDGLDTAALRHDLVGVRANHYFIGIGLRTPGVGSISLPIFGATGMLGALTISGPADRWGRPQMEAAVPMILKTVPHSDETAERHVIV